MKSIIVNSIHKGVLLHLNQRSDGSVNAELKPAKPTRSSLVWVSGINQEAKINISKVECALWIGQVGFDLSEYDARSVAKSFELRIEEDV